ncbi:kinase-like domain-containing protein [Camillea tinctor]|nr:kinase-like domain-containing protein [Camillea tinctor]
MADPRLYLPPELTEASIRELIQLLKLPKPDDIKKIGTIAEYHAIYDITFPPSVTFQVQSAVLPEPDNSISLILRVSGRHLPLIKTLNEVAAMSWVRANTKIPIPSIIAFDASENNPIGHEFILLEKAPGVSVDSIYSSLDDAKLEYLVSQLLEYLIDLHRYEWGHAGGLGIDHTGSVVPGRLVVETFWQAPEISGYWGSEETVDSLNPCGPYKTYTEYVKAHMKQYIRNIQKHNSLEWMRDMTPRLKAFNQMLDLRAEELNDTKYILTHRDLHFGNIMCNPDTTQITAVIDWEFAAVLPLPLWSPGGGFLWNGQNSPAGLAERRRLYTVFEKLCGERYPALLRDFETRPPHDAIKNVLNYVRAIVEVCPRGEKADAARGWRETVESALSKLGV